MKTAFGIVLIIVTAAAVVMLLYTAYRALTDVAAMQKPEQPDPTKLCVDCDHLKESNMYMYCIKSGVTSLVTGRLENLKYCSDCRADETHCGPSGKFYSGENKIKERLAG